MDTKEIKKALKLAREAIRIKGYKEALNHCKDILKADENNYNALVFVGVAAEGLDDIDEAHTAYKRAVEINTDNILGWQGLCSFYEKINKPENVHDLVSVYHRLIDFHQSDATKSCQIKIKLVQLLKNNGQFPEAVEMCENLLPLVTENEQRMQILQQYVILCQMLKSTTDEQNVKVLKAYEELTQEEAGPDLWTKYLQLLVKTCKDGSRLLPIAQRFSQLHPSVVYPWELQAQIVLDSSGLDKTMAVTPLSDVFEGLERTDASSGYARIFRGLRDMSEHNYLRAKSELAEGLQKLGTCITGWYYLGLVTAKLHHKVEAYKAIKKGYRLLTHDVLYYGDKETMERELLVQLATACTEIGDKSHLEEASIITEQLLAKKMTNDAHLIQAMMQIVLKNPEKSIQILEKVTKECELYHSLRGWSHYLLKEYEIAKSCLSTALSVCESSRAHYYMARVLFDDEDDLTHCLTHLLKAAKLDPFHSATFLYLGYYYGEVLDDNSKSTRCFQKAYDLDPTSEDAGAALINCLTTTGLKAEALSVLKNVTSKASAGSAKWAWLQLGLHEMGEGEPTRAIISLQNALRADTEDVHCWECLGEAYMMRGSNTAALKAFSRATELDESAFFCFYQLATIKQTLGQYDEAVTQYLAILAKTDYVPALKGLGETYLLMAKAAIRDFFDGRAVDYCQKALSYLTMTASQRPDLSCVWKLLGDTCSLLHPVAESQISVFMPAKLISQSESSEKVKVNKQEVLSVGSRCYGMAVKLQPDCASLWQDLGINYFHQSKMSDKIKLRLLISKSVKCLQKSVQLDPINFRHWDALGVVAASDGIGHLGLAQHCFIKSIQVEANNVTAWTNLGILYLKNSEVKLAHEAFKVAQSLEPGYVACWIGQSLIAEIVGDEEAMDLFRHTTDLGNHLEGAAGYAHWVCQVLQDSGQMRSSVFDYAIKRMAAIPAASDALAKYVDRVRGDAVACNMYGLLLERQGLYAMSCAAFKAAVDILERDRQTDQAQTVLINYARVLTADNRPAESVEQYKKLSSLVTVDTLSGLGLALYKTGQYEKSIVLYERALTLADGTAEKCHIHAAIGMVAYKMGDLADAKRALFAGSQLDGASVSVLQPLLGIGVLQRDLTLCRAVLQEIDNLTDLVPNTMTETLAVQVHLLDGRFDEASRYLQRAVHAHPDKANVWLQLACYLLRSNISRPSVALRCLLKDQVSVNDSAAHNGNESLVSGDKSLLLGLSSLGGGHHGDRKSNALSLAQKALHADPSSLENWCVLLGAVHGQQKIQPTESVTCLMLSLTTRLMARVESELSRVTGDKSRLQQLHAWCVKHYIIGLLESGRIDQAKQFLQQAAWLYEHDIHLLAMTAAFNEDFSGLKHLATGDLSGFTFELLISLYKTHGLLQEAKKTYDSWVYQTKSVSQKLSCLVQSAYFAYTNMKAATDKAAADQWESTFKDAVKGALKLDPNCSALWLMQAFVSLTDTKMMRLVKRCLHQVIERSAPGSLSHSVTLAKQLLQDTEKQDAEVAMKNAEVFGE